MTETKASVELVTVTPAAAALIERLRSTHGPLMFHQSGGCCDGSAPMCYPAGEFKIGQRDVLLGTIAECEFYIGGHQYERWKHTQLIIDVVPGRGSGFSLEAPEGLRFLTRSRVMTEEELAFLEQTPPRRGPDAPLVDELAVEHRAQPEAATTPPTVLVVDDSSVVRMLLTARIKRAGFEVQQAANGHDALERVRKQRPTLVLTDINMPGMNGFELLEHIRELAPTLPVVILSGGDESGERERANSLGADGFVLKSALERGLVEMISLLTNSATASAAPGP